MGIRNVFIVFLLSGLWHGANWTYVVWGFIHALLFLPVYLLNLNKKKAGDVAVQKKTLSAFKQFLQIVFTFSTVTLAWIFFRSPDVGVALKFLKRIFLQKPSFNDLSFTTVFALIYAVILMLLDWQNRHDERKVAIFNYQQKWLRYLFYIIIATMVFDHFQFGYKQKSFIYFRF